MFHRMFHNSYDKLISPGCSMSTPLSLTPFLCLKPKEKMPAFDVSNEANELMGSQYLLIKKSALIQHKKSHALTLNQHMNTNTLMSVMLPSFLLLFLPSMLLFF
jgi:hypothetical protein